MTNRKKSRNPKNAPKKNWVGLFSIIVIAVFIFVYVLSNVQMWGEGAVVKRAEKPATQTDFTIEGELSFYKADSSHVTDISIEIADDAYSREKGLMYRHFIPDTLGMLFIFPAEDYRAFWMKNTPSSLDILYASADFKIVKIYENTPPYSEETIPSGEPAKYVIEVKAGFVAKYQIKQGDLFSFTIFK